MRHALFAFLLAMICQGVRAAAEPPSDPPSLDDALLDELDNELLEGVGDLKKPAESGTTKSGKKQPPSGEPAKPDDAEDPGSIDASRDPLGHISQEMRQAEQLITERRQRSHAEEVQRRIVDDLARLIEQAERQQSQQQSSSQGSQQQPTAQRQSIKQPQQPGQQASGETSSQAARDSSNRLGRADQARPDPELLRGMMRQAWGHLPERDREQMRQMAPERFLPQYELLIERYYRRLAEERSP